VRGHTLADLLPRSGFPPDRFLEIAIPLTEALAAAHKEGITHRDVKPTNVMVGDDGRVKVLDFGLAKMLPVTNQDDVTRANSSLTDLGHIAGTPGYMSPEQAEGKPVDARSDIFSLGILFYEMLAGQPPFTGDSATAILSSILSSTPRALGALKPAIPRALALHVHRCLEKNPLDRYQSVIDLRHDLEDVRRDFESGNAVPAQPPHDKTGRGLRIAWTLGSIVVVGGAAGLWLSRSPWGTGRETVPRLQNAIQVTSSSSAVERYPTWSPDGQRLAYEASELGYLSDNNHDIWVVQVGSGEPVNLTKTSDADDRRPSWSPDGREIAFLSNREGGWGVFAMPAIGGTARQLLALPASFSGTSQSAPQWSQDGTKMFVLANDDDRNVVITLSLESLNSTLVSLPRHESPRCWDLSVRPDGGRFAYLEAGGGGPEVSRLWTIPASGGEATPLTDGRTAVWSPTWSADGRTIFYVSNRGGSMDLWQQPVADDGKPFGEAIFLTQGVGMTSASFSRNGARLAYGKGGRVGNVWRLPILSDRPATWADAMRVTSEHAFIEFVDVSPDGQKLAVSSDRRGNQDLWVLPAAGGEMTQLTRDPTPDWNPRWSPDGRELLFYALRSGNRDIWAMPSSGGPARQLTSRPEVDWYPTWSPDGHEIAYVTQVSDGEVWIMDATGGQRRLVTKGTEPAWSPDGEWLVVRRQETLFRVAKNGGEPQPLTPRTHFLSTPMFSRDGQSLYYVVSRGPSENQGIWRLSLRDSTISRLTKLDGTRGTLGYYFSASERYLYFLWWEPEGDIWVMDVVTGKAR
jgi:Tol biopolymer transport system component